MHHEQNMPDTDGPAADPAARPGGEGGGPPGPGQVVRELPLEAVHAFLLVRDRTPGAADEDMAALVTSIREVGLSNPICVLPRPGGGFELIQGHRRLTAYRRLAEETGDPAWGRIPALVLQAPADDLGGLYRRMVDENVVRKDLSFAEMAHAAQSYAADPATPAEDLPAAIAELFRSASYSKRSYIRSFAALLDRIGGVLDYPAEIPRTLGVALARAIAERPAIAEAIRRDLDGWEGRSVADELGVLRRAAGGLAGEEAGAPLPSAPAARPSVRPAAGAKTSFPVETGAGRATCIARPGRLEIRAERDFSVVERARLERAVAALIDGLD